MKHLIPHQIHLTDKQIGALVSGKTTNLPHAQMGSGAGDIVVMLHPQTARKMLTSYKKGKGMRLGLTPEELKGTMIQGRGFGRFLHKLGRVGKKIAKGAIDVGTKVVLPATLAMGSMALGDPTGISGERLGEMVGEKLDKTAGKHGYGVRARKQGMTKEEMKEKMAKLRAMRRGKRAEHSESDEEMEMEGEGIGRAFKKVYKKIKKPLKTVGKITAGIASALVGDAVGVATGNPLLGEKVAHTINSVASKGVKKGLKEGYDMSKDDVKRLAIEQVDKYVDKNLSGEQRRIAQDALAGKFKNAEDLIYDVNENIIQKQVRPKVMSYAEQLRLERMQPQEETSAEGSGIRRRGRPRKNMIGAGAKMSKAYKTALKANYGGLELNNVVSDNKPLRDFKVNPKVKPSSDEMTLSPYQRIDSPAMHPFTPTYYFQEGGQSCGYGGRGVKGLGLYGPAGKGLYIG